MMTDRIFERENTRESHSPLEVLEDEDKVEVAQRKAHALKVCQLHVYEGNGRGEEGEENLVVAGMGTGAGEQERGEENLNIVEGEHKGGAVIERNLRR